MATQIAGRTIYPLLDLVETDEFPLSAYLPQNLVTEIIGRLYQADPKCFYDGENTIIEFLLAYESNLVLQLPYFPDFGIQVASAGQGWSAIDAEIVIGPDLALTLHRVNASIFLPPTWLKSVADNRPAEIFTEGDIRFSSSGIGFELQQGATLNRSYLLNTELIVSAEDVRPLFDSEEVSDSLTGETGFQGISIEQLSLEVPLDFLSLEESAELRLQILDVLIDQTGFTGKLNVAAEDLPLFPLGHFQSLPLRFRAFQLDIFENVIIQSHLGIDLRLQFLERPSHENWLLLDFQMGQESGALSAKIDNPIVFEFGTPDTRLELQTLEFIGQRDQTGFSLEGKTSGALYLPQLDLALEQTKVIYQHSDTQERFAFELKNLELGPLGVVETAHFMIETAQNDQNEAELSALFIETAVAWSDLSTRLNLNELPDYFPLPPENATIHARLSWENEGKLHLSFSADVTNVDNLWPFIPDDYRPEVRRAKFVFTAIYDNTDSFQDSNADPQSPISGSDHPDGSSVTIAIELSFRPPNLSDISILDIIQIETADEEGWIEATLEAKQNAQSESAYKMGVKHAVAIKIDLPGLPQTDPPIQLIVREINVNLEENVATGQSGGFALAGDFALIPLNPADSLLPLPPLIVNHINTFFHSLELAPFIGTASLEAQFGNNKAALNLNAGFDSAGIEVDLFDMLAGVTRGLPAPKGLDNPTSTIDLDIEIGFELHKLGIQIGSIEKSESTEGDHFKFEFEINLLLMGQSIPIQFSLSDQMISFGLTEMAIPLSIPRFPFKLEDMIDLIGTDDLWDYTFWLEGETADIDQIDHAALDFSHPFIDQLKAQPGFADLILTEKVIDKIIALTQTIKAETEQKIAALLALDLNQNDVVDTDLDQLFYLRALVLPNLNQEGLVYAAKKFMIQSVFAIYNVLGSTAAQSQFQTYFGYYQNVMDHTVGLIYVESDLSLLFKDVRLILPFHDPSDIRIEGGAKLLGFEPNSPLAPLNDMSLAVGLSADLIYLAFEGSENPLILPPYEGRYAGTEVVLDHFRLGYGYNKNSFALSFAGQLKLPEQLVLDADTSKVIGVGIRLPEESRLAFKLDLIPIVLGEVDFILPLVKFDVDLRKEGAPGIADPRRCEPYWDGLQLHIPKIIRTSYKRSQFAPFYGPLPAPNCSYSYDIVLGADEARLAFVCDNFQIISPVMGKIPIPFIADGSPYFDNQCLHIQLAGFGLNINLQRPLPSMSPLAILEVIGLLADPMMPIDPKGALADTMYVSLQHMQLSLPSAVVEMFPGLGMFVDQEVNYHLNLGSVISITQKLINYIGELYTAIGNQTAPLLPASPTRRLTTGTVQSDFSHISDQIKGVSTPVSASEIISLLPPELRQVELHGSFIGFKSTAIFLLLTPDELTAEFEKLQTTSFVPTAPPIPNNPEELKPFTPDQLQLFQPNLPDRFSPIYLPSDPDNSLLKSAFFDGFSAQDINQINLHQPQTNASAVIVGAVVNIYEVQKYAFMGYMYSDGHFGLISKVDIEPLKLSVAGIPVEIPFDLEARLALQGLARGAESYASIKTYVTAVWGAIPNIAQLTIGRQGRRKKAVSLELDSRGYFAAKGITRLSLFSGAAKVDGSVDISHTHCFVSGRFHYRSSKILFKNPLLELKLLTSGRLGPQAQFELKGRGLLKIAGNEVSNISAIISNRFAEVSAKIDTDSWSMNNLQVDHLTMAMRGSIDISNAKASEFLLEGETFIRLFGSKSAVNRLEIEGRGGIQGGVAGLVTFVDGRLSWQGKDWLQGKLLLHSASGVHIEGQTHFGMQLSPGEIGGVKVASLYFRVNMGGVISISPRGSISCDIRLDWSLGVNLPGNEKQTLPLASDSRHIAGSLRSPIELIDLEGFSLLPLEGFNVSLPIPVLEGKGPPILKIGQKNNKIAIYSPPFGTIYLDEREFVSGITGGQWPTFDRGRLPTFSPGKWPSVTFGGGINIGSPPTYNQGRLPSLNFQSASFPESANTTLSYPRFSTGSNFDSNSDPVSIFSNFDVNWENNQIPINLSTFKSLPIRFGILNETYQFFVQIGRKRYGFNGQLIG